MQPIVRLVEMAREEPNPPNILNDDALSGLTWGDLLVAWRSLASPGNQEHVEDFLKALWKQSLFLPERFNLEQVLTATVLLAGPPCFPPHSSPAASKA